MTSDLEPALVAALKALDASEKRQKKLQTQIRDLRSKRTILCAACDKMHAICDLELIQTHWYVSPSGCTEGDYWLEGEWQFVCPQTNVRNRISFWDDAYDVRRVIGKGGEATFKHMYEGLFKSTYKMYEDKTPSPWVNNTYVDQNRTLFELPPKI